MNRKGFATLLLIFIIAAAITALGILLYREQIFRNAVLGQGACTLEARVCPDGSTVGRTGPDCQFAACPPVASCGGGACPEPKATSTPAGKSCGGIAPGAFPCPEGYVCKLDAAYPDAGGHCVLPDGTGTLSGKVTIGPNCPVEQINNPCPTPPGAYASRELSVTQNGTAVTTFHADQTGSYLISLAPGTYTIASMKSGIGYMSKSLPATVTIAAGATSILNIDIDTGIR